MKNILITFAIAITSTYAVVHADLPATLKAGDQALILNGGGTRRAGPLTLYNCGLYLTQRNTDPASIIAANEPMAIRIVITSRLISQSKLDESLSEGFERATNGNEQPISEQIASFRATLTDPISKGDILEFTYDPAAGVAVGKNGQPKGMVSGLAFKQALFGIWLGDKPADAGLKRKMLNAS